MTDMTSYYIIKNKKTGLWDICTDKSHNPPLDKYRWATDFKTEEEARNYLTTTLKMIKGNSVPIQITKETLIAYKKSMYTKAAGGHILYGLLIALIGLVITIVSYELAPPGGIFIVAGGAVIGGIYYFLKGIYYYIKSITIR
ncbi:MAG: hypothetical protein M1562_02765 [Candidatus Marsarchaeota archaeon]|jgi:hypothetical protein|nr:hypothetical protein [Candidatus Marsarchaeota archaeon]